MRIRNLDKNGDWTFGRSNSNYLKNEAGIFLDIETKLKEWYKDCFFELLNGIPWSIRLGSKNQKELLDKDILEIIRNVQGVLNVFDFQSTVLDRRYRCQMNIYTIFSAEPKNFVFDSIQGIINE